MKIHYHPKLTTFSRELRKSGTLAEVLLWKELKGKKLKGCRFLRQKPIEDLRKVTLEIILTES